MNADIVERESIIYDAVASGALSIDDAGRIWKRGTDGPVRAENPGRGYLQIRVTANGRRLFAMAHRIVYRHFNGPVPAGLTINHKDGVRTNNAPPNLETATPREQTRHAIEFLGSHRRVISGQRGEDHLLARLTSDDIVQIRRARAAGESLKSLGAKFGVAFQTISKIASGARWSHIVIEGEQH